MADYEFVINGINYKHGSVFCTYATNERFINGDSNIIVVVQKNNSKNNELIETRDDLIKYNIVKMDTIGLKCDVSIIQNII